MTEHAKIKLAVKAIRHYAQEHYGWGAKYHPEQLEKFEALMDMADNLETKTKKEQE